MEHIVVMILVNRFYKRIHNHRTHYSHDLGHIDASHDSRWEQIIYIAQNTFSIYHYCDMFGIANHFDAVLITTITDVQKKQIADSYIYVHD